MLYHGVTLVNRKRCGKRHLTVREGALVSAHAAIDQLKSVKILKLRGAVVVSDVPADVTVVGVPAKLSVSTVKR